MNHFATSVAVWLADFFLLGSVLLVVALATLVLLKQPAHRLAVTKSTLVAIALLAALCALPGWSIVHLFAPEPSRPSESPIAAANGEPTVPPVRITPQQNDNNDQEAAATPIVTPPPSAPFWTDLPWPTILAATYAVGSMCVLTWLCLGGLAARRLLQSATPAPTQLANLLAALSNNNGQNFRLLLSTKIDVAVAIGIRHPAIVLPQNLTEHSSSPVARHSPLNTILAHELTHITNHDLHWLAASRAILVLLWPQPLFWLLRRRMRLDQETLADAAAAELTTRQTYAEQLVAWARNLPPHPAPRLSAAVGLWEGPSQLRERIALLLDERFTVLRDCSRRLRFGALVIAIVSAITLSTITFQPQRPAAAEPATSTTNAQSKAVDIPRPIPNTILGRTLGENGRPIAGADVFLFRVDVADFSRRLVAQKASDAHGDFRFDNVIDIPREFPNGTLPPLGELGAEVLQLVVRAPGRVTDDQSLLPSEVAQRGDVAMVTMRPAATLRGRVTDRNGKPVAGAIVSIGLPTYATWEGAFSARTDSDGNYAISDVAPFDMEKFREAEAAQKRRAAENARKGATFDYVLYSEPPTLVVEHPDFASKKTDYEKIPGTRDVQLEAPAIIEGRVIYGDTARLAANVLVNATTSRPKAGHLQLFSIYDNYAAKVRTDANGRYRFTTLPAGRYDLWADVNGFVNVGAGDIAAAAEKSTSAPDLVFSTGGLIRVRLVDVKTRQPIELPTGIKANITAVNEASIGLRPPFFQSLDPRPDGTFEIRAVPGANLVYVSGVAVNSDHTWTGAATIGEPPPEVNVAEGETVSVDVPVVAPGDAMSQAEVTSTVTPANLPPAKDDVPTNADKGAADQPVDIPIIVAKHVLLHDGKIIEWADVERLVAGMPNPKLARPAFYLTNGAIGDGTSPNRQEELRPKAFDLYKRFKLSGMSWASLLPRAGMRYDAIRTADDLVPNAAWRVTGTVETADGLPIDGAQVILCPPVEASFPYKTLDITLRNDRLRDPLDEIVTESDNSGRFAVYPPPKTMYYVIALHKEGFGLVRGDEFAKTGRIRIEKWGRARGAVEKYDRFKQTADVSLNVSAVDDWPELTFHLYGSDLGPPPPDSHFAFDFIPPSLHGWLSRSIEGEKGTSYSLPTREIKLAPGETLDADIGPPTDADLERLKDLSGHR